MHIPRSRKFPRGKNMRLWNLRYEAAVVDADAQAHPQQCAPNGRVDHENHGDPRVAVLLWIGQPRDLA